MKPTGGAVDKIRGARAIGSVDSPHRARMLALALVTLGTSSACGAYRPLFVPDMDPTRLPEGTGWVCGRSSDVDPSRCSRPHALASRATDFVAHCVTYRATGVGRIECFGSRGDCETRARELEQVALDSTRGGPVDEVSWCATAL